MIFVSLIIPTSPYWTARRCVVENLTRGSRAPGGRHFIFAARRPGQGAIYSRSRHSGELSYLCSNQQQGSKTHHGRRDVSWSQTGGLTLISITWEKPTNHKRTTCDVRSFDRGWRLWGVSGRLRQGATLDCVVVSPCYRRGTSPLPGATALQPLEFFRNVDDV